MLTELRGVSVGHATLRERVTGCTVVLFDELTLCAADPRGGMTACSFTDGVAAGKSHAELNGLFITGGSVAGLCAQSGIVRYLREHEVGVHWSGKCDVHVPLVSGAVIADRGLFHAPFDPEFGYLACTNARNDGVELGNVGAGTGATVGKFAFGEDGRPLFCKGGIGGAVRHLQGGLVVAALTVVNAMGNVYDRSGRIIGGNRTADGRFVEFDEFLRLPWSWDEASRDGSLFGERGGGPMATTVSIVGTNARIGHEELIRVVQMAHAGMGRAIRPVYSSLDGDTIFAFTTGEVELGGESAPQDARRGDSSGRNGPPDRLGPYRRTPNWHYFLTDVLGHTAAEVVHDSIISGVLEAEPFPYDDVYGEVIPSHRSLRERS